MINKVPRELVETMILVTSTWLTQLYNTLLIRTSIQRPLLLLVLPNLLLNPLGKKTSPCENQVPEVSGMENHRKTLKIQGISSNAAKPRFGGQVQSQVTNRSGASRLVGAVDKKSIQSVRLYVKY